MSKLGSRVRTGIVAGIFFFGLYVLVPSFFICLLISLSGWMIAVEWPRVNAGSGVFSYWYPTIPLVLLVWHVIQWCDESFWYALYPFVAAWLVDAAGYIVGSRWGRHYCWPTVSPHKTWEGVVAGIGVLSLLHGVLLLSGGVAGYGWGVMLIGAPVIATVAIVGDFFVSWHKRQRGIKDTGTALPGHGGLLDRFDSVLAVVVVLKMVEVIIQGW